MKGFFDETQRAYEVSLKSRDLGLILAALSLAEFRTGDKDYGDLHDDLRKVLDTADVNRVV